MNAYTSPNSSKSAGSCGCGGGGAAAASKCSCGGSGCSDGGSMFVRPRFFAGQLLTEEDLQALSAYVTAKGRLHNRYLFGEGVVCGLEVTCHPCGGGVVIVNPGYALDCCGNDLQLACAQELDINSMVRDLRRDMLGGYDCGDPCADSKIKAARAGSGTRIVPAEVGQGTDRTAPPPDPTRRYCLYMRYCEEETDPVSPYTTDESCGFQTCEPSRVRESVRFELRCEEDDKHPVDLFSRVLGCIGDIAGVLKSFVILLSADSMIRAGAPIEKQAEVEPSAAAPVPAATQTKDYAAVNQRLSSLVGRAAPRAASASTNVAAGQTPLKDLEFEEALRDIRAATALLAARLLSQATAAEAGETAGGEASGDEDEVESLKSNLRRVLDVVRPQVNAKTSLPLERAYSNAVIGAGAALASEQPTGGMTAAQLNSLSTGSVTSTAYLNARRIALLEAREELLDRLDSKITTTTCSLRADLLAIPIPAENSDDETLYLAATYKLFEAWIRYLIDCVCLALNPTCQPCTDTGVLLACVKVKDCDVVEICNMERSFVLAPASMRYWMPPLRWLGDLLEKVCCTDISLPVPKPAQKGEGRLGESRPLMMQGGRAPRNVIQSVSRIVSDAAAAKGMRLPRLEPATFRRAFDSVASAVSGAASSDFLRRAFAENPEIQQAASGVADAALANIEERIDSRVAAALTPERLGEVLLEGAARAAVSGVVDEHLESLAGETPADAGISADAAASLADERISAALDAAKLTNVARDLKDLKRLRTENEALKKNLDELSARVKKLEG